MSITGTGLFVLSTDKLISIVKPLPRYNELITVNICCCMLLVTNLKETKHASSPSNGHHFSHSVTTGGLSLESQAVNNFVIIWKHTLL